MGGTGKHKVTPTRDKQCAATLRVAAMKRKSCVTVTAMVSEHNHPLTEQLWKQYPKKRILDPAEQQEVMQLQRDRVPNQAIVKTLGRKSGQRRQNERRAEHSNPNWQSQEVRWIRNTPARYWAAGDQKKGPRSVPFSPIALRECYIALRQPRKPPLQPTQ